MPDTSIEDRIFLYIDILGFSDMVSKPNVVRKIYERIDSLNVFSHAPYFKCIVFSDTILVYSSEPWSACKDKSGAIMWMCEFAQDLFYRLLGDDLHFRALLTVGSFEHSKMKNIDAFFGEALVRTYRQEKNIVCMGLVMHKDLVPHSNIFDTSHYGGDWHFVHIMQTLGQISVEESRYPLYSEIIFGTSNEYLHAYDFVYLKNIYRHMINPDMDPHVRAKYLGTWQMLRTKSEGLMNVLVKTDFDPAAICTGDWDEAMARVGTEEGFFG